MTPDSATRQKLVDQYNFVKAEDFFDHLDMTGSGGEQASEVLGVLFNKDDDLYSRQLILDFANGKALSLRFIRPQIWRLCCNFDRGHPPASAELTTFVMSPLPSHALANSSQEECDPTYHT